MKLTLSILIFLLTCFCKAHAQSDSTLKDTSEYTMKVFLTQSENGDSVRVNCRNCALRIYFTKAFLPIVYVKEDFQNIVDTTLIKHK